MGWVNSPISGVGWPWHIWLHFLEIWIWSLSCFALLPKPSPNCGFGLIGRAGFLGFWIFCNWNFQGFTESQSYENFLRLFGDSRISVLGRKNLPLGLSSLQIDSVTPPDSQRKIPRLKPNGFINRERHWLLEIFLKGNFWLLELFCIL